MYAYAQYSIGDRRLRNGLFVWALTKLLLFFLFLFTLYEANLKTGMLNSINYKRWSSNDGPDIWKSSVWAYWFLFSSKTIPFDPVSEFRGKKKTDYQIEMRLRNSFCWFCLFNSRRIINKLRFVWVAKNCSRISIKIYATLYVKQNAPMSLIRYLCAKTAPSYTHLS